MKRFLVCAFVVLLCSAARAHAAALDVFTITGDGHTVQFVSPTTVTTAFHPHVILAGQNNLAGSIDGVNGYTFNITAQALILFPTAPVLEVSPSPLPPFNGTSGPSLLSSYLLYGPLLTKLLSAPPSPIPGCYYDQSCLSPLTFQFVPGHYALYRVGPGNYDHAINYTLDITAESSAAIAPEPSSWFLLLTGVAFAGASLSFAAGPERAGRRCPPACILDASGAERRR